MREEGVGQDYPGFAHKGLLPHVERPHQDTERVDVRPGGDLDVGGRGRGKQAVAVVT